jgi:pre-mRNA-processing factor 6
VVANFSSMSGRKDFLSQPAPENYVAGLGRGATGFTTRSDLGPAREGPSEDQIKEALAKRAAQLGAAPPTAYGAPEKKTEENDEGDDERFQDPENETGLFSGGDFTAEDDAADRIYQDVDERMEKRRKSRRFVAPFPQCLIHSTPAFRTYGLSNTLDLDEQITDLNPSTTYREAREAQERVDYEANNPKIQQQFADLKRSLASVSEEDWANLPEAGDLTSELLIHPIGHPSANPHTAGKNKRTRTNAQNRFYAVPDSVIAGARDSTQMDTSVQDDGSTTNGSVDGADGTMTNFADIGAARDKVLQVRLDQAAHSGGADSTSGTATNIDPKGYLTSLSKTELKAGEVEVGDINRVRVLLESVIKTNTKHPPGFLALSRLEELAGKVVAARKVVARGCEINPTSEDLWVENIRLNEEGVDKHNAKVVARQGIEANPLSVRLYLEACRLENDTRSKKRVCRMALDVVPKSVQIWKTAISLEDDESDARLLLSKAVEEIPLSTELWIAYAKLCPADDAQKVLNKARLANPTSFEVWGAAARLAETTGKGSVDTIIKRAVQSLARESAMLKREEWITEAEKAEIENYILTAGALIRETLGYGIDEDDDRKSLFLSDAQASISRGKYETARAIYAYALRIFPTSEKLWRASTDFEKDHPSNESSYVQLLEKSTEACPSSVQLWLSLAKAKLSAGGDEGINAARVTLGKAFNQLSSNEDIWLAAVKLEADNGHVSEGRQLLQTAREQAGTDRVWYRSVAFERQYGKDDGSLALDLVDSGLQLYPKQAKLHMQKGQIYLSQGMILQAREAYNIGTRACPTSVPLFILLSRLEEADKKVVKARSVLERGIGASPKSAELRLEQIRVERRAGNLPQAKVLMAKALQALPTSGVLWSESIWHLEPRTQRKPRSLEAIKKCDNDPTLFVTVARVFWGERRLDKAANWFEKAILLDADLGDTWAWYLKFLLQHGTEEKTKDTIAKAVSNEPKHGELWQAVAKDPKNTGWGTEQILKRVANLVE